MHICVLVIGDDVEGQMAKVESNGRCDWWGYGGRYTGLLPLKRGAEGKIFGYAVPPFESAIAEMLSQVEDCEAQPHRLFDHSRDNGADQARAGDIDIAKVYAGALLRDGVLIENDLSPKTIACSIALAYGMPHNFTEAEIEAVKRERDEWQQKVRALLATVPPDALVTVVDIHN